jgi:cytochrome c-type biogenesis protein CcsB
MTQIQIDIPLFWLAFSGYGISCLASAAYLGYGGKKTAMTLSAAMGLSIISHAVAIITRTMLAGRIPMSDIFEYINLLSFTAAAIGLIVMLMTRRPVYGAFICPAVFMLMATCSLLPKEAAHQLVPALQSVWLPIHVSLTLLGEAAFTAAFAAGVMHIVKPALARWPELAKRLPSFDRLEAFQSAMIRAGYPLFTVGALFAGAVWAKQAWGSFWSWDPKETCALLTWLVYSAFLLVRHVFHKKGLLPTLLNAAGFACLVFTLFSSLFIRGMHSYAQ